MDKFRIEGGHPLHGKIKTEGAKNAALPILLSTLLTDGECIIDSIPDLRDIRTTFRMLEYLGKSVRYSGSSAVVKFARPLTTSAPYELVKQMRASVLVAGPLLARFGRARVPLPGGCAIGLRPVDIHLKAFAALGADIATDSGDLLITARELKGAKIKFSFPSVGATENLLMCACLARGRTVLENAAQEPEIDDLVDFLNAMGAKINRTGPGKYRIDGVESLKGAKHKVIPDRIVAGTYLIAAAACGGSVTVCDCEPEDIASLLKALRRSGAKVKVSGKSVAVSSPAGRPKPVSITTEPHPGFPTDLQAQWLAYMCSASGQSCIKEQIFENRFMHVPELARVGALIAVNSNTALVDGVKSLSGARVMSSDLRGGAALVIAGLCAKGATVVDRVYHVDRGYEKMEKTFVSLGAKIERVKE